MSCAEGEWGTVHYFCPARGGNLVPSMPASEWGDPGALSSGLVLWQILEPLSNIAQVSGLS